jgi:uncharacterized protein YifE (UPF0438 family)
MIDDKTLTDTNFDLEQGILKCWNIVDDLKEILEDLDNGHMTQDEVIATLRGHTIVYQNRFDRTWTKYETVCRGLHQLRHTLQNVNSAEMPDKKSGKKSGKNVQKMVDQ